MNKQLSDGKHPIKCDFYASQKFLVEAFAFEGAKVTDALYLSWDHSYKGGKQYCVLRGYVNLRDSHYTTYVRSFKDRQTRWICYDDDCVTLDAKEALFLLTDAKLLLYDSCNEEEYHKFVHSEVGTVKIFEKMKNEMSMVLAFITYIQSLDNTADEKKTDTITEYVTALFHRKQNRDTTVMYYIQEHCACAPNIREEMEVSILSFFSNIWQTLKKKTKANFVKAANTKQKEKQLVDNILATHIQVLDCSELPKVLNSDITEAIWKKIYLK